MGSIIICSLLSILLAAIVIIKPLFMHAEMPYYVPSGEAHVFDKSLAMLEALAELDGDFQSGKLTEAEYNELTLETQREYLKLKHQD